MNKAELQADKQYFEPSELADFSLKDLQTLWDSVPSEEQAYLTRVFEREADKRQVVEDLDEARIALYFLEQYREIGFVPAGDVWLKVPQTIREQYKLPLHPVSEDTLATKAIDASSSKIASQNIGLPRWIFLVAIPFACLIIFAIIRVVTGANSANNVQEISLEASFTPSPSATLSPTPTFTPLPPTATPFALSGFDDAITAGDRASRDYYPVQLQIFPNQTTIPRVFIVQEQRIGVAEWAFDRNPDVVSWLSGMLIRPVLGVPFNHSNLELFRTLTTESIFVVTMNTGQVLQFSFQDMQQVSRAETNYFRQDSPGLVLVLIGETFADGSPTDLRYLVRASYPNEQELGNLNSVTRAFIPIQTVHTIDGLSISVQTASLIPSPNLPSDLAFAVLDIQLRSGDAPIDIANFNWSLGLNNSSERLMPDLASTLGNCAPMESLLPANTATCASLSFVVSRYATDASLFVETGTGDTAIFEAPLTMPTHSLSPSDLDVQLGRISYTSSTLTVRARIFNPTEQVISISAEDFSLVLGFVPNPTGLAMSPILETQTVEPSSALNIVLEFPYAGEGFGMLTLLGRIWSLQV